VWVESGGPKCCSTSASFECTAQRESFPRPNPHRMCGPKLHICRHLNLGVWGLEWERARTIPQPYIPFFRNCLPLTAPISTPRPPSEPEKYKLSDDVLRSGNGAVDAKLCLERLIWPRLPKKGATQWWGQPVAY